MPRPPTRRSPLLAGASALALAATLAACVDDPDLAAEPDGGIDPSLLGETEQEVSVASVASCATYSTRGLVEPLSYSYSVPAPLVNCDGTCTGTPTTYVDIPLGRYEAGDRVTLGNCGLPGAYEGGSFLKGSVDAQIRTAPGGGGSLVAYATSGCGSSERFLFPQVSVSASNAGNLYLRLANRGIRNSSGVVRGTRDQIGRKRTDYDLAPGENARYTLSTSGAVQEAGTTLTAGNCGIAGGTRLEGNVQLRLEESDGTIVAVASGGCGTTDHDRVSATLHTRTTPYVRIFCPSGTTRCRGSLGTAWRHDANPGLTDPIAALDAIGDRPRLGQWWTESTSSLREAICRGDLVDGDHYQGLARTPAGSFVVSDNLNAGMTFFSTPSRPAPYQSLRETAVSQNGRGPIHTELETAAWRRGTGEEGGDHSGGIQMLGSYLFNVESTDYDISTKIRQVKTFEVSGSGTTACGQFSLFEGGAGYRKGSAIAAARVFDPTHPSGDKVVMAVYDDQDECPNGGCAAPRIQFYVKRADADGFIDPTHASGWQPAGSWQYAASAYVECEDGTCGPHTQVRLDTSLPGWATLLPFGWLIDQALEATIDGRVINAFPKQQAINLVASRDGELYLIGFTRGMWDFMPECIAFGDACRSSLVMSRVVFIDPAACSTPGCVRLERVRTVDLGAYGDIATSIDAGGVYIDGTRDRLLAYTASKWPSNWFNLAPLEWLNPDPSQTCKYIYLSEW